MRVGGSSATSEGGREGSGKKQGRVIDMAASKSCVNSKTLS